MRDLVNSCMLAANPDILMKREVVVKRFVKYLCSDSSTAVAVALSQPGSELRQCISSSVGDSDIVCNLPSMEIQLPNHDNASVLPNVGASHSSLNKSNAGAVPTMAASIFKNGTVGQSNNHAPEVLGIEQALAATNLSSPTSWTRSTLAHAPGGIMRSVSSSFTSLVESRIKSWTMLLLKHSLSSGDAASRARLFSLLRASSDVETAAIKISFLTVPLPPGVEGVEREADVILPIIMSCEMTMIMQGRKENVEFGAAGTIAANFANEAEPNSQVIKWAQIKLDTHAMVETMVEQARLLVLQSVAHASAMTTPIANSSPSPVSSLTRFTTARSPSPPRGTEDKVGETRALETRTKKAAASALRLNSILHGRQTAPDYLPAHKPVTNQSFGSQPNLMARGFPGKQKTRSVTWLTPMEKPSKDATNWPESKRSRLLRNSSLKRSTKSFGKPDASYFESARNATFADFGGRSTALPIPRGNDRVSRRSATATGINGLMRSRHSYVKSTETEESKSNETFDPMSLRKKTVGSMTDFIGVNTGSSNSKMPRTATALENLLLSATGSGTLMSAGSAQ